MKQQKSNWIINLILFIVFLLMFYLDFTGLTLHQWLGIAIGLFIIVHFWQHFLWVKATIKKFNSLPGRIQINLLVDSALLFGMVLTIVSGLVISTWLKFTLSNYDTWRILHITFSVETLITLLVKLILHWKVVVLQVKRPFFHQEKNKEQFVSISLTANGTKVVSRRDFLVMAGAFSLTTALTITHLLKGEAVTEQVVSTQTGVNYPTELPTVTDNKAITQVAEVEPTATPIQSTATIIPTNVQAISNPACTVRCPNGCSYPGRCHRYIDSNGNNKCDLGECI